MISAYLTRYLLRKAPGSFLIVFLSSLPAASTLQNISATDGAGNQVLLAYSGSQNNMQSFQLSWKINEFTCQNNAGLLISSIRHRLP